MGTMRRFKIFVVTQTEAIAVAELIRRLEAAAARKGVTRIYLGNRLYGLHRAVECLKRLPAEGQVQLTPTFSVRLLGPEG